jgi:hypothetical protein
VTEPLLGAGLLLLLAWHVVEKLQTGLLPEMLWACHLATLLTAAGLLLRRPTWVVTGGLFHLAVGLPGWLLETLLNGTTPSSLALHLATPAIGVWAARRHGVPGGVPFAGTALWLGSQGLGRLCDPALNVNVAWHPYGVFPAGFPTWGSHLLNLGIVSSLLAAVSTGMRRVPRG